MNRKPVQIHLKPDAVPQAVHVPIPIPIYWKDQVKADIERQGFIQAFSLSTVFVLKIQFMSEGASPKQLGSS